MPPYPPPLPLLICSLGNPGAKYITTLHSSGHLILAAARLILRYPEWRPHLSGQMSTSEQRVRWSLFKGLQQNPKRNEYNDDWTFWQSGSLMNVSGPGVRKVWDKWLREWEARQTRGKLIVVHDELESEFGAVSMREGSSSARGHNGVRSVQAAMGKTPFVRICIGIGRPESREKEDVARYVLRNMTQRELKRLDRTAHDAIRIIRDVSDGVR